MTSPAPAQQRALEIALADFCRRVSWDASTVAFLRKVEPGESQRRGGGIDAGTIERITYPR